MSNASFGYSATPFANAAAIVMTLARQLAQGTCPSCGRHTLAATWAREHIPFVLCSHCHFTLAEPSNGNGGADNLMYSSSTGELGQDLLFALALLRTLKRVEVTIRREVLALAEQGARVEAGDLGFEVRQVNGFSISQRLIEQVLGRSALTFLKEQAPTRVTKQIYLRRPT